ncbi:MAG: tyrosine-type recombinase/integrase [Dehalococcoidia bacterium]|jgi:site-specific recombinase XerD|nr:tyrosine-type recombinase/integrase [Dehalococcoidia bacterium]MDP6548772.1 tyrosine-type recombinase/integrase [Dehalococcoidia bacterium]
MVTKRSRSHVSAPNHALEPISDEDLIRGFLLDLGASGRSPKTLFIYGDSVKRLSAFARDLGFPLLATIGRDHVRHWLMSLHQKGNKPGAVHVRYRSANRFFKWCVKEGEREDNPVDHIDPPRLPQVIQPYYEPPEVEAVLKAIGRKSTYALRDTAVVLTLFDSGVRAAELCGMQIEDLDWRGLSIKVTGKAGKERHVGIGHKTGVAIERYLRRRQSKSPWLWLTTGNRGPFTPNGLRMMLERHFQAAGVPFRGAHGFRRGFAMAYLAAGGQENDLKELGGWSSYQMVSRYARGNAGERAVNAHKKLSPGDRLNVR